jgi:predicted transport protein
MGTKVEPSVEQFLESLAHPFKPDILKLRKLILSIDPGIREAVKWNAPSFYTGEHFATMRLNGKPQLQLILHMGAKKNEMPTGAIQDPQNILKWLGPDRACVNFTSLGSVDTNAKALKDILQQWMQHIPATQAAG